MAPRVLFLALDAADKDLIETWANEGSMPTFRALREKAAWGPTANPTGLFVGAIWPSFWTGLSPARHGRYCFSQIRTGSYDQPHITPYDTRGEAFWNALGAAGRRVAIVDVPKTRLSRLTDGIQLVDWGTHDPDIGFQTWPEPLAQEILERIGRHPVGQCDDYRIRGRGSLPGLRDALLKGIEMKTRLVESLLDRGPWDLFAAVFAESHCAGHQFWHLHDPTHPGHDPAEARAIGDPIREVYAALDAAIGRLLTRAGEGTTVLVLASHGMGAHYDATFLLDEILRRLSMPDPTASERALARGAESAWRFLPEGLRRALRPLRGRVKASLASAVSHPELASLKCFSVPNNDVYGGIRINLVGREPQGRIRPGPEYEAFCDTLTADLLAFVNLETGKPLVRRVLRTSELYQGERLQDLPDLMVEWERDAPVSAISSPKTGTIRGKFPGIRTGDHKPEGMVFAMGPGIRHGRLPRPISVTEFAPTIAARLGVRLANVDAAPVAELAGSASGVAAS